MVIKLDRILKVAVFLLCSIQIGCSSSAKNSEVNYSLTAIYNAVEKELSMGVAKYSENHRVFYSKPFVILQNEKIKKSGYRERGVATVYILGDVRPYSVEVEVKIERAKISKNSSNEIFQYVRDDKTTATKLLSNIIRALDDGDKNRNVIDDFKPF